MQLIIWLSVLGIMMSVYLPMLPFILWFGGMISWFVLVAEALVAAPLWAMTHLDTDGEGMGGKTSHGYIFILNLLFRPALMVLGFLIAGGGIVMLGTFLMDMFGLAMASAQQDSLTGLFMICGYILVFFILMSSLIHGCFNAIHLIPDQVLNWVGGHASSRFGAETADKAFGVIVATGSRVEGMMGKLQTGQKAGNKRMDSMEKGIKSIADAMKGGGGSPRKE